MPTSATTKGFKAVEDPRTCALLSRREGARATRHDSDSARWLRAEKASTNARVAASERARVGTGSLRRHRGQRCKVDSER